MQSPYEVPFVEVCAQDSGITFPRCDMMHMNWSYSTLEDCNGYVTKGDEEGTESQCYLLDTEGAYRYGVVEDYDENAPEIRRVDVYWKLDSIANVTAASISIPTVTIQIYDPRFNPWNDAVLDSMIPQEVGLFKHQRVRVIMTFGCRNNSIQRCSKVMLAQHPW